MSHALAVVALPALVFVNALLVAAQFAIVSTRPSTVGAPVRTVSRRAKLLEQVAAELDRYVATLRLAISATTLAAGALAIPAIGATLTTVMTLLGLSDGPFANAAGALAGLAMTIGLVALFGELTPKLLGLRQAERVALWTSPVVYMIGEIARPVLHVTVRAADFILRLAGVDDVHARSENGEPEELRSFLAELSALGRLSKSKRVMLENVFEFAGHTARQVMIPRDQIEFLSLDRELEENLALVRRSSHTRYPLCESELDSVVSMVHIKDLFQRSNEITSSLDLRSIQHDMLFVPESQPIDELQRLFQKRRAHMAIVVDEYGVPTGLVTMEDVLEELVGEIRDEFDTDEAAKIIETDAGLLVDGMLLIEDLCRELDVEIDDGDADTVGGYATSEVGRIPRPGDRFQIANYGAEVVEMQGRRVARVLLQRGECEEYDAGDDGDPPPSRRAASR